MSYTEILKVLSKIKSPKNELKTVEKSGYIVFSITSGQTEG